MEIAIIIPTLNEADNVGPLVARIERTGLKFSELIFVDDGSTDGTREKIQKLSNTSAVRLVARDGGQRGLAGAILAGANSSRAEIFVVMDADLSHPPHKIAALVAPIFSSEADLVIGSRYIKGGATPGWPLWRRALSRTASSLAYPLTHVRDSMCGFFATRRECLLQLADRASGFKIVFEMIVRGGKNLRVREIPIAFCRREHGASKMSVAEAFRFALNWTRLIFRRLSETARSTSPLPTRKLSRD